MDSKTFREFGKATVDFIADYMENIRDRDVLPSVNPGYLHDLLPNKIPENSENWKDILNDIEKCILPGITHWQSPNFHAYYPTATSFPSIIGEMLSAGFGVVGFSWICSPACTELEVIVMDWVAKFLNLPEHFLNSHEGPGGGVIQGSASEAVLVALLTAREQTVKRILNERPDLSEGEIRAKMIAYSSDQSNSCVEKDGVLAAVPIKLLPTSDDFTLRGSILLKAIQEDIANDKIPVACIATLGTTGTCAYDNIPELAEVCNKYNIWLHVDAAYAGAAFALPEYSDLLKGLDKVDSINFNLHKFMMINFDCCAMWFKNASNVVDSFNVNRIYLKHKYEGQSKAPDYRHWQIPLGRRFRALKVWITLRSIGADGLRFNVRKHIKLAERFENYVINDNRKRFEIVAKRSLGLLCFRLKGDNKLTKTLLERLNERKQIYVIEAKYKTTHFLRFVICGLDPQEKDIDFAWNEISEQTDIVLQNNKSKESENSNFRKQSNIGKITDDFSKNLTTMSTNLEKIL